VVKASIQSVCRLRATRHTRRGRWDGLAASATPEDGQWQAAIGEAIADRGSDPG
jgi:hypothetical protein